jgi:hypothetical protein
MSNPNSSWATPKYWPSNQMRSMAINVTKPLKKIRRKFLSARTADQNARPAGTFQQGKPDMRSIEALGWLGMQRVAKALSAEFDMASVELGMRLLKAFGQNRLLRTGSRWSRSPKHLFTRPPWPGSSEDLRNDRCRVRFIVCGFERATS